MGVGEAVSDKKLIDNAVGDLTKITGQKPLLCKSKKSIASFKLREGLAIGTYEAIAEEVIRPTPEEVRANPRCASAKFRWGRRANAPIGMTASAAKP